MKKTIIIEGMMCAHCTRSVEKELNNIDGVKAEVNLEDKAAYLEMENEVSEDVLRAAIDEAGYEVVRIS